MKAINPLHTFIATVLLLCTGATAQTTQQDNNIGNIVVYLQTAE